jgi:hypothetical protein
MQLGNVLSMGAASNASWRTEETGWRRLCGEVDQNRPGLVTREMHLLSMSFSAVSTNWNRSEI